MNNIEVKGLRKSFMSRGQRLQVLDGIDFRIDGGSFVCILGPSGSGKSVTLHIIAGLLSKDEGSVFLGDSDIAVSGKPQLAFVFQSPRLLPWKSVENNIKYVLKGLGQTRQEMDDVVHRVLEKMDLVHFKKYYPHQISGGMQQRVALARALALESDIILMDEPFSSLDEITAIALREELIQIWQDTQKTIAFVTHNIAEACYLADKIVMLTPKPTQVYAEININLPRPRDFGGEQLFEYEKDVFRRFETCLVESKSRKEDFI